MLLGAAAGCGGGGGGETTTSAESGKLVAGPGFTFRAPDAWTITVAARSATATQDATTLSSVTVLPLVRPYRPALFKRVVGELDGLAATLARKLGGNVTSSRTIDVAGGKVRQYEIEHADMVDRLTFVLRGKREFLLTCRWRQQDGAPAACDEMTASFRIR